MRRTLFAALVVAVALSGFSVPAYAEESGVVSASASDDVAAIESQDAAEQAEDGGGTSAQDAIDEPRPSLAQDVSEEPTTQPVTDGSEQGWTEQPEDDDTSQLVDETNDQVKPADQTGAALPPDQAVSSQESYTQLDDRSSSEEPSSTESLISTGDNGVERIHSVVTIAPKGSPKGYLAVSDGKVSSSTSADTLDAYWHVIDHADGTYSYRNAKTDTWLVAEQSEVGSSVVLRNDSTFRWRRFAIGNNLFSLALVDDDSLRVESASGTNGLMLRLAYVALDSSLQQFVIDAHQALSEAATSGKVVEPGVVSIATDAAKERLLDVRAGSKDDKANVQIYESNSSLAQKWELEYQGYGLYSLRAANSAKMLDVRNGSVASGANIQQFRANGTLAQLWYFVKDGKTLSLRSAKSGLALEVNQGRDANGANVQLGSYTGSAGQRIIVKPTTLLEDNGVYAIKANCATGLWVISNNQNAELGSAASYLRQYWRVVKNGKGVTLRNLAGNALQIVGKTASSSDVRCKSNDGTVWEVRIASHGGVVLSPLGAPGLALDVAGAGKKAGTNVRLWTSNDSEAQSYEITPMAALTEAARSGANIGGKIVTISTALDKGKVLDIAAGSMLNEANVRIYAGNGTLAQKWELTPLGNGLYELRVANSGRMLDVRGASSKSGANVQQYASNNSIAQLWYLVASAQGGYVVRSAKSGLALDVACGKTANGTNVRIFNNNGSAAQRWVLSDTQLVSDGNHGISWSVCKPLVVDVASGSKAAGANVRLYLANGTAAQQFVFKRQSDGTYTIVNKNSGLYLEVKDGSTANGANVVQGKGGQTSAAKWRIAIAQQGGLSIQNVKSGKYLEVANGTVRLGTNIRQASTNATLAQSFVTVEPGYNPKINKIGWQNPAEYPQVSQYTVSLPSYARGSHSYVSPSTIRVDATREECIEAFIKRAYDYLGTTFNEPWSTEPGGVGVDCSGLVLQCLYATGMDLEHAAGTQYVGGYNPHNHYYVPEQTYNSARWYENGTFKRVSTGSMQRGDLVFYGYYGSNGPVVYHVAIYLGGGQIIHATSYSGSGNKVRIDDLYVSYYQTIIGVERPFV